MLVGVYLCGGVGMKDREQGNLYFLFCRKTKQGEIFIIKSKLNYTTVKKEVRNHGYIVSLVVSFERLYDIQNSDYQIFTKRYKHVSDDVYRCVMRANLWGKYPKWEEIKHVQ
jgi:hypothetical protein